MIGAIIEKGPKDWQILQQSEGFAEIELSGRWSLAEEPENPMVYARVVREDTGENVVFWIPCEMTENCGWRTILRNVPAGGLYRIETCIVNRSDSNPAIEWGTRGDMIHHTGVGDLYVIAGQSNSAGYGRDFAFDPPELGIHILRNSGRWDLASHPFNESTGTIHEENMERLNPGHSPYLSFARMLKKQLGYPIGILQAALGGSAISMWDPCEDGILYKNMLNIIRSQNSRIKGVLWYQGCSEAMAGTAATYADTYMEHFLDMVTCLRKDLLLEDLPVLTVQLNRILRPIDENYDVAWGKIRELQRQIPKRLPNVYVVPTVDCTLSDFIHNNASANLMLGERLARMALGEIYRKGFDHKAPDIISAEKVAVNRIYLVFKDVKGRLDTFHVDWEKSKKKLPFTVEDMNGKLKVIDYEYVGRDGILLILDRNLEGTAMVHGAYEQNPEVFVPRDSVTQLPMLSFYGVKVEDGKA